MGANTIPAPSTDFITIKDTSFSGTAASDLVSSLNRIDSQLPSGSSFILRISSSSQPNKVVLLMTRISAQYAGAISVSYLSSMNGLKLRKSSSTWTIES